MIYRLGASIPQNTLGQLWSNWMLPKLISQDGTREMVKDCHAPAPCPGRGSQPRASSAWAQTPEHVRLWDAHNCILHKGLSKLTHRHLETELVYDQTLVRYTSFYPVTVYQRPAHGSPQEAQGCTCLNSVPPRFLQTERWPDSISQPFPWQLHSCLQRPGTHPAGWPAGRKEKSVGQVQDRYGAHAVAPHLSELWALHRSGGTPGAAGGAELQIPQPLRAGLPPLPIPTH